jgi:ABC-2 type transport system ATP-binding protein
LRGVTRGTITHRVDQVKLQFDLLQVGRQVIGKLSRGFQQRVGLAQALVHQPSVVIMDEPTLGLDPLQTAVMRRCIVGLRAQAAVILSSHHLSDVQAMCGRVVILRDGRHAYSGAVPFRSGGAGDRTRVILRQAPTLAAVRSAPGVLAAEQLDEMTFHLTLLDGDKAPELFISHAVGAGWRLAELRTETRSLEETFAAIVGRDPMSWPDDRSTH